MTNEASNNLLKTLEEPGDACIFLLVTSEPKALLTTIVSRCQRLKLRPQTRDQLRDIWLQEGCEKSTAEVLAALDLRGFAVSPETLKELRPLAIGWLKAVNGSEGAQELDLAEGMSRQGSPELILRILRSIVSDLLALKAGCAVDDLSHRDRVEELESLTALDALTMAEVLDTAPGALRRNVSLVSILTAAARGERLT
jgi:DNA polymerase-3 subunit delta'